MVSPVGIFCSSSKDSRLFQLRLTVDAVGSYGYSSQDSQMPSCGSGLL